ncbi:MAG: P1 family peptidase [Coriobacteriaceae bacterium]|jgi:L-aminopeptidase/D-esterase-like protein|nr:P1 family peptidase [Coriobacteriaceae bacterium]
MLEKSSLGALSAFRFGHAHDDVAGTGCTVVVAPQGACCGVDVRGGGPATRETDLLRPENMIEDVHAVVLAGGSAFGLEASCGVMEALAGRDIGFHLEGACVPIVVGACLFDLLVGENRHPDKAMGAAAVAAAFDGAPLAEGNVGAGTGASVGKLLGSARATKAGFGVEVLRTGELVVGALVALNALGNVVAPDGRAVAGCRDEADAVLDGIDALMQAAAQLAQAAQGQPPVPRNTTLGVVVTNARLTKAAATKVSSTAQDAYARAIKPVHTSQDGDTVFTLASGEVEALPDLVAAIATEALQSAIYRAVKAAEAAYGLPAG